MDRVGGFGAALLEARRLAGLRPNAPVDLVFYPQARSIWERLLNRTDAQDRTGAMVRSMLEGRVAAPGPGWLRPMEFR